MIKLTAYHNTTAGVTGQAISFFSEIVFGISCYKLTDKWCIAIEKHSLKNYLLCSATNNSEKEQNIVFSSIFVILRTIKHLMQTTVSVVNYLTFTIRNNCVSIKI